MDENEDSAVTKAEGCRGHLNLSTNETNASPVPLASLVAASSRSHSLFQIIVEQTRIEDGAEGERVLKSKFNLVDLAGSEKWDTRKERKFNNDQISELTNINLSLYTLGRCIAALAKNGKALEKDPDAIPVHVPYRESKLTRLLQDSLGGNSKTVLIATLSPASDCLEESVSTLRFADRAHSVMTFVKLNEKRPVDHALVQRLQSEVGRLRALLRDGGSVNEVRMGKKRSIHNTLKTNATLSRALVAGRHKWPDHCPIHLPRRLPRFII